MLSSVQTVGYLSPAAGNLAVAPIADGHISLKPATLPANSLTESQVTQYSKSVYSVLLNTLTAQLGGGAVGGAIAQENLLGPFASPPPPAGSVAGIPVAPGASHGAYAAQVVASLRSLAGNGQIFQTEASNKH